jgi:hypothetical protein
VTWVRGDPAATERTVDTWKAMLLPRLEEAAGFCSVSLMVDRQSGRAVSAVTLEDREAMERGREPARRMREELTRTLGGEILEVAEFDLVIAHLRVPELV